MLDSSRVKSRVLVTLLLGSATLLGTATVALAQSPDQNPAVRHLIGLENIKNNASGQLTVENGSLEFKKDKTEARVPIADIDDIFTGAETTQSGGTPGRLVKLAAPYGSGRALSLLMRNKVDILTVSYHGPDGGLHGAIFALPKGQGDKFREQLIHAGAHATPVVAPETQQGGKQ
jgi:hypothetical protein